LARGQRILRPLLWWVGGTLSWLPLTGSTAPAEIAAGAIAAAIATVGVEVVQTGGLARLRARPGLMRPVLRLPLQVLRDSYVVLRALGRHLLGREPLHGAFLAVPFDAGGDDAEGEARRAATTLYVSLTPNAYVVEVEPGVDVMVMHQLVTSEDPTALLPRAAR
jgi:multisubunit Na+/H+ antiporter MnhE subunit